MDETTERRLRRTAISEWLRGFSDKHILRNKARSARWLQKWKRRFTHAGWAGLKALSRRPHQVQAYPAHVRQTVIRVRRQLAKRKVGRLLGARAIQREIRRGRLLPPAQRPSITTIKRIVRDAGLIPRVRTPRKVSYPEPRPTATYAIQAMDWTARYLHGGAKVYAFHTLDLDSRDLYQTLADNKRGATAEAHTLESWATLGLPDAVQIDNDAAWCGSPKTPRCISHFMRLALWCGVEIIFIPVAEPKRNGTLERVNGLWNQQFWELRQFASPSQVRRSSPDFVRWYRTEYEPPSLGEHTPAEARRHNPARRLTAAERHAIPDDLPLTAGRLHFLRLVDAQGDIQVLHESWHIDKRLAGQYVWATIVLHQRRLDVYFRRSPSQPVQLRKSFHYALTEPVRPLLPCFKRTAHRRKMCTMF